MTQKNKNVRRVTEFNALFLSLDEKGQETALNILQSLDFAQSIMRSWESKQPHSSTMQTTNQV